MSSGNTTSGLHGDSTFRGTAISELLANDTKVRVAGIDTDGVLRGKIMDKEKFLSSIAKEFGISSAIFGWDIHDALFTTETKLGIEGILGYADFLAYPDVSSFRRLPSEDNIPFFLLNFFTGNKPMFACPRSLLRSVCSDLAGAGLNAYAGGKTWSATCQFMVLDILTESQPNLNL